MQKIYTIRGLTRIVISVIVFVAEKSFTGAEDGAYEDICDDMDACRERLSFLNLLASNGSGTNGNGAQYKPKDLGEMHCYVGSEESSFNGF
jgi:hypothetical protein